MPVRKPPGERPPEDDTALLIAALNHALGWYEARIDRGLQVINYFLVASAVLATAYVSAIDGKHYTVAAVIALSGTALTGLAFIHGRRQRRYADTGRPALSELQSRVAERLKMDSFRILRPAGRPETESAVRTAFGLAAVLSIASALYALIH
jgi:hypothetical protein